MLGALARSCHTDATRTALPFARTICTVLLCSFSVAAFAARVKKETVDVEVVGVKDEIKDNILAHLSIAKLNDEADEQASGTAVVIPEDRVRRLHGAAPAEVEEALQPFGYYEPEVRSTLQRSNKGWVARYDVSEGEPTLLR